MTIREHLERATRQAETMDLASGDGAINADPKAGILHALLALAHLEARRQRRFRRRPPRETVT